jgi:cyanophycinase
MAGRITLVGGDEFRPGCEEMDRAILEAAGGRRPTVLVVPTAAAAENPSRAASNGVAYFSSLGADASALMVLDGSDADNEERLSPVDSADVIYFTGGNPAHLLESLRDSALLRKVRQALDRGGVVAGSSAGAMVMGPWMRFRGWREALGVAPGVATLPHHERSDPDTVAKELSGSAPRGVSVLGVDGRTCCLGGPEGWRVVGAGSVTAYGDGRWRRFSPGETLTLDPTAWG